MAKADKPFTHIVVDEAQDLGVPELRFLAGIAADGPDALFFAGDLGQRIFQQPFSWKTLGVDVRGRSQTLKVNYRTSHQIRAGRRPAHAKDDARCRWRRGGSKRDRLRVQRTGTADRDLPRRRRGSRSCGRVRQRRDSPMASSPPRSGYSFAGATNSLARAWP